MFERNESVRPNNKIRYLLMSVMKTLSLRPIRDFLRQLFHVGKPPSKPRPYPNDYSYQASYMQHIPEGGIILDIASGHNPFPHATILSDRYLELTQHRREEIIVDQRPFVMLDIHHLPFAAKSIDYIYCSHVIEHAENPLQACFEMMRVGKAGYIETPTLMKDTLFSWAHEMGHKWHVVRMGNRLVFFEYDERRQLGVRSSYWAEAVLSEQYHPLQDLFYPNLDIFNTFIEWDAKFNVTVFYLDRSLPVHLDVDVKVN
ncbi:MAG: methyltransferase domain-containing protein [Chloroflexota bacterium]